MYNSQLGQSVDCLQYKINFKKTEFFKNSLKSNKIPFPKNSRFPMFFQGIGPLIYSCYSKTQPFT